MNVNYLNESKGFEALSDAYKFVGNKVSQNGLFTSVEGCRIEKDGAILGSLFARKEGNSWKATLSDLPIGEYRNVYPLVDELIEELAK